jgi:hypothetical protein
MEKLTQAGKILKKNPNLNFFMFVDKFFEGFSKTAL